MLNKELESAFRSCRNEDANFVSSNRIAFYYKNIIYILFMGRNIRLDSILF